MSPEEADKLCEKYNVDQAMGDPITAILEAYRLGIFKGLTRAAEICNEEAEKETVANYHLTCRYCRETILTERDKENI